MEEIVSDIRQGRMVVLLDDDTESHNEGVVMLAAEHCEAQHVTFMARRARGLICLAMTQDRAVQLDLPPMVDAGAGEKSNFTLSIEAAQGIDTGISAADRAHTVRTAVAPHAVPNDIVQPGHIFPLTALPGGVLTRAGHTEAAADYARLAGLLPAAVIADVLTGEGHLADGAQLREFARDHELKVGSIADLIHFRMLNERTIERIREGVIETDYGSFNLTAYREDNAEGIHLALSRGDIKPDQPTLVRVHLRSVMRDLFTSRISEYPSWNFGRCLQAVAEHGSGVIVLLAQDEAPQQVLDSIDLAMGDVSLANVTTPDTYTNVGLGSQILKDLGVGKIHLMGAPIKYNAISGFDLEVSEYIDPKV